MPVHKFITPQRRSNLRSIEKTKVFPHDNLEYPPMRVGKQIFVFAQKDMKIGWDPKIITLGIGASIAQTPIFVSLPQELRHRRLGLINSIIAESCNDIIVSLGYMPDPAIAKSLLGRRRRDVNDIDEPFITIAKGSTLFILMM